MYENILLKDSFDKKVALIPFHECWEWNGKINNRGYGVLSAWKNNKKEVLAHRLSYLLHNGDISQDLFVLHSCDNPSCVNPNHLRLGTHKDNMGDMKKRKRKQGKGRTKGYKKWCNKLTKEQIAEIRLKYNV